MGSPENASEHSIVQNWNQVPFIHTYSVPDYKIELPQLSHAHTDQLRPLDNHVTTWQFLMCRQTCDVGI